MKMYKKSDLTIVDGLLVNPDTGDIVTPSTATVWEANELERLVQKAMWLRDQPEATPAPDPADFVRVSEFGTGKPMFHTSTPTLDAKAEEAMRIMAELDDTALIEEANQLAQTLENLVAFVSSDNVIDTEERPVRFDMPLLGSILELDHPSLMKAIGIAAGMDPERMEVKVVLGDAFGNVVADAEGLAGCTEFAPKDRDHIKEDLDYGCDDCVHGDGHGDCDLKVPGDED